MSDRRRALRAWLVAAPVYVAAATLPAGGLFRSRAYVDLALYHRYAAGFLDGTIPYRDTFVEYPRARLSCSCRPRCCRTGTTG